MLIRFVPHKKHAKTFAYITKKQYLCSVIEISNTMITFIISLIALVVGFVLYGTFVERVFGIDEKAQTPAITQADGVDFVPMKPWRIFLV